MCTTFVLEEDVFVDSMKLYYTDNGVWGISIETSDRLSKVWGYEYGDVVSGQFNLDNELIGYYGLFDETSILSMGVIVYDAATCRDLTVPIVTDCPSPQIDNS